MKEEDKRGREGGEEKREIERAGERGVRSRWRAVKEGEVEEKD